MRSGEEIGSDRSDMWNIKISSTKIWQNIAQKATTKLNQNKGNTMMQTIYAKNI